MKKYLAVLGLMAMGIGSIIIYSVFNTEEAIGILVLVWGMAMFLGYALDYWGGKIEEVMKLIK